MIEGTTRKVHKEGDIWTEGSKKWTIKNGVKISISPKDEIRSQLVMPLQCPHCHQPMGSHLDEKMWSIHQACFDCMIKFHTKLVREGKFEEYSRRMVTGNIVATLRDLKVEMEDFVKNNGTDDDSIITDSGVVEEWVNDQSEVRQEVAKQIDLAQSFIEEFADVTQSS